MFSRRKFLVALATTPVTVLIPRALSNSNHQDKFLKTSGISERDLTDFSVRFFQAPSKHKVLILDPERPSPLERLLIEQRKGAYIGWNDE